MTRMFIATALAALITSAGADQAVLAAEEPIVWRYQTTLVEDRQEMEPIRQWAKRIEDGSNGRLKVDIYYGGALGIDQSDELRAIRQNAIEVAQPYPGYLARDLPEVGLALVQGAVLTPQEAVALTSTLQEIFTEAYAKWNAKVIGWSMSPIYDMSIMCKDKVGSLDDLKGKKLRVWSRDQVDTYSKLDVAAQIIPQNETYLALQTGVVDCAIYVVGNASTVSFQEVTDYAAQLHTFSATPNPLVVNEQVWEELPEDLKSVVLEAGEWLWQATLETARTGPAEKEAQAAKEFADSGVVTILPPFPTADKERFYQAVLDIWKDRADAKGGKAVEYRQRVMDALDTIRSQ